MATKRGIPGLADKLGWLLKNRDTADGQHLTIDGLAWRVTSLGVPLSSTYVRQILRGGSDAPSAPIIDGIARLYGIPTTYFTDPAIEDAVKNPAPLPDAITEMLEALSPEQRARLQTVLARKPHDEN